MQRLDRMEYSRPPGWPVLRWGLPIGLLLVVAGYLGPWVWHWTAGLVILGADLAEYVKFLAEVRSGALLVWREWFILPAIVSSVSLTLTAVNRHLAIRWYVSLPLLLFSLWVALSVLPPAWTPALLQTPEFIKQTIMMGACVGLIVISPLLRRLPALLVGWLVALLHVVAAAGAAWQYLAVRPPIGRVYGAQPPIGWGLYVYAAGIAVLLLVAIIGAIRRQPRRAW